MTNNPTIEQAKISRDLIAQAAPSVFAEAPLKNVSDKYEFIPTSKVLDGLMEHGFMPVHASQTGARSKERASTNRHMLRFRHPDLQSKSKALKGSTPEIILLNSHNGSCCYRLMFGIFRFVCSNGLISASSNFGEVTIRHIHNVVDEVIEASYELIEEAPNVVKQINSWAGIELDPKQQLEFAKLARTARPTHVEFDPQSIIEARRPEDAPNDKGMRDLWTTMNVAQENLIKGGFHYQDAQNNFRAMREVKALHANEIINRNLWGITEDYQQMVAA